MTSQRSWTMPLNSLYSSQCSTHSRPVDVCKVLVWWFWRELGKMRKVSLTWMYAWNISVFRTLLTVGFNGQSRSGVISSALPMQSFLDSARPAVGSLTSVGVHCNHCYASHSKHIPLVHPHLSHPKKTLFRKLISPSFVLLLRNEHLSNQQNILSKNIYGDFFLTRDFFFCTKYISLLGLPGQNTNRLGGLDKINTFSHNSRG